MRIKGCMCSVKLWAKAHVDFLTYYRQLKQTAIDQMIIKINCRWF